MNTSTSYSTYPAYPKRGEIYYVKPSYDETGSEMWSGRPGIIVSNNQSNKFSNQVMVVYLTTKPKSNYPTNVPINTTGKPSTAICEQVVTVAKERLGEDKFVCTAKEMAEIDEALKIALALPDCGGETDCETVGSTASSVEHGDYLRVLAERDVYEKMCKDLLATLASIRTASA